MADRKFFPDSVSQLPETPGFTPQGLMVYDAERLQLQEPMGLLFSFNLSDDIRNNLEERVARGEQIPAEVLNRTYATPESRVKKLATWLKKEGYEITRTSPDGIYATRPPTGLRWSGDRQS